MGGTAVTDAGGVPAAPARTLLSQRDVIIGALAAALDKLIEETTKHTETPATFHVNLKFGFDGSGTESTALEFEINLMTYGEPVVEASATPDATTLPNQEAAAPAV